MNKIWVVVYEKKGDEIKEYKNFINGKFVDSRSGRTFENRNPANWDEIVGVFPKSNAEDLNMAVDAAKKAYPKWRAIPLPKKAEIMWRAAEIMISKKEDAARLMTREMGKVIKETRVIIKKELIPHYMLLDRAGDILDIRFHPNYQIKYVSPAGIRSGSGDSSHPGISRLPFPPGTYSPVFGPLGTGINF